MDFAGAVAMPLSIFSFVMMLYLSAKVGELEKQVKELAGRPGDRSDT
jgi:hypothetical protein